MPDQIPIYPTEENKAVLKEYLSLQNQLEDVLQQQVKTIEEIREIDVNLENSIKKRLDRQIDLIDLQKSEQQALAQHLRDTATVTAGEARKNADLLTAGFEQKIRNIVKERELLSELNAFDIAGAKKRFFEGNKWYTFASKMSKEMFGFSVKEFEQHKAISEELSKYPYSLGKASGILAGILVILQKTWELFQAFDKSAANFRTKMGFVRSDVTAIRSMSEKLAIDFMHIGVTIDGAYNAVKALGEQMGSIHLVTTGLAKTTAVLASQLGVSEENTAGFLRNMAAISGNTLQSQQNMAFIAADMSRAAGVPLNDVMKDMASRSSQTLTMMSRVPNEIVRTAIEARRLNTSLDAIARSSREILNFTDNISAEMEASVLLGHSINLQRARELAYRRDIEGSTKEILRITKQIDFQNLDTFQMEAFARATGKSVDELLRIVQAERQWDAARKDPELSKRIEGYDKLRASNQANAEASAKNYEILLLTASNQERITAISQKWHQIMARISGPFLRIVDFSLGIVDAMMSLLPIGLSIISWAGKFGGLIGRVALLFGKWVPGLGMVILAGQGIVALFSEVYDYFKHFGEMSWSERIINGLMIIPKVIYKTIVAPFVDAFNSIMRFFGGHSPSMLALNIVKGIESVSTMIFDALTYPFRTSFAWIMDKIPGMGKIADKLRGGLGGILNEPVENRAGAAFIPAVSITPNGTRIPNAVGEQALATEGANASNTDKTLQDILMAINTLNKNLENGRIGINIDGQLLSATLARQTEFRGGYGVNKV
jgi:hypothetical protein